MNKQKAVEILKNADTLTIQDTRTSNLVDMVIKSDVIAIVELIDEPQKPLVQQFVADWYEEHKDDFEIALFRCIDHIPSVYDEGDLNEFEEWIIDGETKPFQTLVNMHQFGYEKGVEESHKYLNHRISLDSWFFSGESEPLDFSVKHTRKELEEAGFEEVFNSPLFEVKEVEE